jgi:hypothetical protein
MRLLHPSLSGKKALLSTRFMDCLFLIYGCESAKGISQTLLRQIML